MRKKLIIVLLVTLLLLGETVSLLALEVISLKENLKENYESYNILSDFLLILNGGGNGGGNPG